MKFKVHLHEVNCKELAGARDQTLKLFVRQGTRTFPADQSWPVDSRIILNFSQCYRLENLIEPLEVTFILLSKSLQPRTLGKIDFKLTVEERTRKRLSCSADKTAFLIFTTVPTNVTRNQRSQGSVSSKDSNRAERLAENKHPNSNKLKNNRSKSRDQQLAECRKKSMIPREMTPRKEAPLPLTIGQSLGIKLKRLQQRISSRSKEKAHKAKLLQIKSIDCELQRLREASVCWTDRETQTQSSSEANEVSFGLQDQQEPGKSRKASFSTLNSQCKVEELEIKVQQLSKSLQQQRRQKHQLRGLIQKIQKKYECVQQRRQSESEHERRLLEENSALRLQLEAVFQVLESQDRSRECLARVKRCLGQ